MTTATANQAAPDTIIRLPEVIKAVGLSRATIYRRMAEGHFPKQVALSESDARSAPVGWSSNEIAAWIEATKKARSAA